MDESVEDEKRYIHPSFVQIFDHTACRVIGPEADQEQTDGLQIVERTYLLLKIVYLLNTTGTRPF